VSAEPKSAGDALPPNCELIEVHVAELKQLFKAIDPSPFREKDLDADAEDFIVGWAKDVSAPKRGSGTGRQSRRGRDRNRPSIQVN